MKAINIVNERLLFVVKYNVILRLFLHKQNSGLQYERAVCVWEYCSGQPQLYPGIKGMEAQNLGKR